VLVYLAPFVYVAALAGIYLYAPENRREIARKNLTSRPNFYLICGLALSILAIIADRLAFQRSVWLAILVWVGTIALIWLSARRALESKPDTPSEDPDHLS
jgi:hypothetical protein